MVGLLGAWCLEVFKRPWAHVVLRFGLHLFEHQGVAESRALGYIQSAFQRHWLWHTHSRAPTSLQIWHHCSPSGIPSLKS